MSGAMQVTSRAVERLRTFVDSRAHDTFVRERQQRNVDGPAPKFDREEFWFVLLGCLMTTQQRSTKGAPVDRFLETRPFSLTLAKCKGKVKSTVEETLTAFGGIRMAPTIARRADKNSKWLEDGGWAKVEEQFRSLAIPRGRAPQSSDSQVERKAANFADAVFEGIGSKQSRNLWQWLGLTRYEIPIDSRITKWVNANLSFRLQESKLGSEGYYAGGLDILQSVCKQAGVLPCIFDAAAFDYTQSVSAPSPSIKGVTIPGETTLLGHVNANGQVTVRNTGQPGTDHLQYIYQLACSHCGEIYGANGSDIHDRKCPECQDGAVGLPLAKGPHAR